MGVWPFFISAEILQDQLVGISFFGTKLSSGSVHIINNAFDVDGWLEACKSSLSVLLSLF